MTEAGRLCPWHPPIRVYLDVENGRSVQLMPIRGVDVFEKDEDHPDGIVYRVYHAFGPGDMPTPTAATVRIEPTPDPDDIRVNVRVYQDMYGVTRFSRIGPIYQTNN